MNFKIYNVMKTYIKYFEIIIVGKNFFLIMN
jgi:hypothetical protein